MSQSRRKPTPFQRMGKAPAQTSHDQEGRPFDRDGWACRGEGPDGCVYERRGTVVLVSVVAVLDPRDISDGKPRIIQGGHGENYPAEPIRWLRVQTHAQKRVLERRELHQLKVHFLGMDRQAVELYDDNTPDPYACQLWARLDGALILPQHKGPIIST